MLAFRPSDTSLFTNYYVDITTARIGDTTTLTISLDIVLSNSTALAEGVTREAQFFIGGQKLATQLIKAANVAWTGGSTYQFQQVVDIYTPETLASERWMKILILPASGSDPAAECVWSAPENITVSLPARPVQTMNVLEVFAEKLLVLPSESIRIYWEQPTESVTDFEIACWITTDTEWKPLAVTTDLEYVDTALPARGLQKRYSVRSRLAGDPMITSEWTNSPVVTVKPLPGVVKGIRLSASTVPVGWPVEVSFPAVPGAVSYQATVQYNGEFFNNQQILGSSATTTLSLDTSILTGGRTYQVRVRAVDSDGEAGPWSTESATLTINERVFRSFDDTVKPLVSGNEYGPQNEDSFQTVSVGRVMRQLKQIDLYRAKYIDPNLPEINRRAWCFHGGKAQGWSGEILFMVDPKSGINKKLLKMGTGRTMNVNTTQYPYFSFAPALRLDRITDILNRLVVDAQIQVAPTLLKLTGRTPVINEQGIHVEFNRSQIINQGGLMVPTGVDIRHFFCRGDSATILPASEFKLLFGQLIEYIRSIFPLHYTVTLNGARNIVPANDYQVIAFDLNGLVTSPLTSLSISASFGPSAWNSNPTSAELQNFFGNTHGIEYIKLDSTNVFSIAPYQYVTVSSSHENNVRILAEQCFGLSQELTKWSDGKSRVASFDTITQSWLPDFYKKFPQLVSGCKTCDIFTCQCNGQHHARVYCTACHSSGGSGADAGNPCTRCFTTRYSYTYATCPSNVVLNCTCGYGGNTKCNGNTCRCNGSRHLLGYA